MKKIINFGMSDHKDSLKDVFKPAAAIPAPADMPTLYVTHRKSDVQNDNWAGRHPDTVVPGTGWRFLSYSIPDNAEGTTFTDLHRDGYSYGFTSIPYKSYSGFWGEEPMSVETQMFAVDLKWANDIYVVDEQPFLDARDKARGARAASGRQDDEIMDYEITPLYAAIGDTMVPLAEYKGGYTRPIYLIGRPLGADEAKPFMPKAKQRLINEDIARRYRPNPALDELFNFEAEDKGQNSSEKMSLDTKEPPRKDPDGGAIIIPLKPRKP